MKRIFMIVLIIALMFTAAGGVYASSGDSGSSEAPADKAPSGEVVVTGFTVYKNGHVNTGSILRGEVIELTANILDTRIKAGNPKPHVALNTASFSQWSSDDTHQPSDIKVDETNGTTYSVTFHSVVYTGVGNEFTFDVTYSSKLFGYQELTIPLKQAVPSDGKSSEDPEDPDGVVKGTGFVLKDAGYGIEPVYAGKSFTLSATILATNGSVAAENVSVSFTLPEEMTFSDGSSVVYIGTMAPGASVSVKANLLPSANITEGSYAVSLAVAGVNGQTGEPINTEMKISVPVLQPERFEIFSSQLPTDLTAGMSDGMGYGSITLVNQGKGTVANVSVEIVGDGVRAEEGRQYVGNVNGGAQTESDFNLIADAAGTFDAKVLVSYENVRGEQKTLEQAFTVNVMDGGMMDPGMMDPGMMEPGMEGEDGQSAGIKPWVWIVIAVAAAAVVTILLLRRRKKRLAAAEAALDYTEDDEE